MDLALFDFDGTITTRELMPDFMYQAVPRRRLAWGRVLLAPLIVGYKLGLVSGSVVRAAIVRVGLAGMPLVEFEAHGERFARETIPAALRPEMLARLDWHRQRGDTIAVVSGAFDVYLRPWCEAHGLTLLCSSLAHRDHRLTGRYAGSQCVRKEKARRVRATFDLSHFETIHAYGDTPEDRELLALAHRRHYRGRELDEGQALG